MISKKQRGGGWGVGEECETAARLRLMRFLSKRFTAGVFRNAHQSQLLRAPTAAKLSGKVLGLGLGPGLARAGGRTFNRSAFSVCVR